MRPWLQLAGGGEAIGRPGTHWLNLGRFVALLALTLALGSGCGDPAGIPGATLMVTASTTGIEPDLDGSPDGTTIAFSRSTFGAAGDLYLITPNGAQLTQLTPKSGDRGRPRLVTGRPRAGLGSAHRGPRVRHRADTP